VFSGEQIVRVLLLYLVVLSSTFSLTALGALVDDPIKHESLLQDARSLNISLPQTLEISGNALINGTFELGLTSWNTSGSVQVASEEAVVSDTSNPGAYMYQSVGLTAGVYTISFDFSSGLSSNFSQGNFPDTFFASLYFIQDINQFDLPGGVFDDTAGLMDMDWAGVFNNLGVIGPSLKGPEWSHFSRSFNLTYNYAVVAFEVAGLNGDSGDSSVQIDNVAIVLVPEPSTLAFVMAGMLILIYRRRCA
jgi:hypothetical protein